MGGERPPAKDEHRWVVYCVDFKTGKIRWDREVYRGILASAQSKHLKNSYASETPVTDGERVYAYFGNVGLFCFDMKGKALWSKKFGVFKTRYGWGTAASPVLYRDRIYIVNDNDEQSFILALDKKTGEQIWRTERKEATNWATPYIWENEVRTEIVTSGTNRVRSYDLDGKLLWEFSGMSSIAIPTPFSKFGLLYIASGYVGDQLRPVYAIRAGATGDISLKQGEQMSRHIAWHQSASGTLQSFASDLRRSLLYALRPWVSDCPRCKDGQGGVRQTAHRPGDNRVYIFAVGVQRKDFLFERGRRHLCDSSGK